MDVLDQLLADAAARRQLPPPAVCRALRQRAGLTQADIGRALGVGRVAVTRWESGARRPRRDAAVAYARVLERLSSQ